MTQPKLPTLLLLLLLLLPAASLAANCTLPGSECVAGSCNSTTHVCDCTAGTLIEGTRCDTLGLYSDSMTQLTKTKTYLSSVKVNVPAGTKFEYGIPLSAGEIATSIYVCSNGYVTFNRDFCTARVNLLSGAGSPSYVAPLASAFDFSNNSAVSYSVVDSVDSNAKLKWLRDSRSELAGLNSVIVVTWETLAPAMAAENSQTRSATVQLFLFTDLNKKTIAFTHYKSLSLTGAFTWLPAHAGYRTAAGITAFANDRPAVVALAGSGNQVEVGGVNASIRTDTVCNATAENTRRLCLMEVADKTSPAVRPTSTHWCPQTLSQAVRDIRFNETSATGTRRLFNMIPALPSNGTNVTCAFDIGTGALLLRESYSNISNYDRSAFYDACCVKEPSLCSRYYSVFLRPSTAEYLYPEAAGFVSGAGNFRTFDSLLYKFMSVGDFWLMQNEKTKMQIRMQNIGSNASACVTGVTAEFRASANLTVQVLWKPASQEFESITYTINNDAAVTVNSTIAIDVISNRAIIKASGSSMFCYTLGNTVWMEVSATSCGLSVSVYVDSTFKDKTAGLLGSYDKNSTNDVAKSDGTLLALTPTADAATGVELIDSAGQAKVPEYLQTWSANSTTTLFNSEPPTDSAFSAVYWSAEWNSNVSLLTQSLFGGNDTIYSAAVGRCSPSSSILNETCLLQYSACSSTTGPDFLSLIESTKSSLTLLTCTAPKWKLAAAAAAWSVTEGQEFTMDLKTMIEHLAAKSKFSKLNGPTSLLLNSSQLTWSNPSQADLSEITLILTDTDTNCSSAWPVTVKFKRNGTGVCENSAEGFDYMTSSDYFERSEIYLSKCQCNSNYYTSNCSFATCELDCDSCNSSVVTECSSTCSAGYNSNTIDKTTVCYYVDQCKSNPCSSTWSTACTSIQPSMQTDTNKYQCTCKAGYQYPSAANKTICIDIDECTEGTHTCQANQVCENTAGSYKCNCKSGYQLNNSVCVDINECSAATPPCESVSSTCVNNDGGYTCQCKAGFNQVNSTTCEDINECENPKLNQCQQKCNNTVGNYTCECNAGYVLNGDFACELNATLACAVNNKCQQLCAKDGSGAEICSCNKGYTLNEDKKSCNATDFCGKNPKICGDAGTCANSVPGFTCTCNEHYELNAAQTCSKIDYCGNASRSASICPTGSNVKCSVNATTNAPTCVCVSGFAPDGSNKCVDVDECRNSSLNNCQLDSTECRNLVGSFRCDCKQGYQRINETACQPAPYTYSVTATFKEFTFTAGMSNKSSAEFADMSNKCEKKLGVSLPPDGSKSPTVTVISLSNGSVVADTSVAYTEKKTPAVIKASLDAAGVTATVGVVNECQSSDSNQCTTEHNCVDTTDGYECRCKTGYTQIGTRKGFPSTVVIHDCVDVNECLTRCTDANKTCTNVPGSYKCVCANGTYSENPMTSACEDPCKADRCQNGGSCQYLSSSEFPYRCVCVAGYTGRNCEQEDSNYWAMQRNLIIVGVVLGVLLLIALIVIVFFFLRKIRSTKHRADLYQSNFSDSPVRRSEGTYKGTQSVPLSDSSGIPRAQQSTQHPSSFENRGYERDQSRSRTDYF